MPARNRTIRKKSSEKINSAVDQKKERKVYSKTKWRKFDSMTCMK